MLTLLLALSPAFAAPKSAPPPSPCQAQVDAVAAATPNGAGKAFAELAACDAALAKTSAPTAFANMLAGPGGDAAMLAALKIGAGADVRAWIGKLQANERAAAVDVLGKSCDQPGVAAFWTETAQTAGDDFWTGAWFKGLDECRDASVRPLLTAALEAPVKDRTRYLSLIEVASRNYGVEAIPMLGAQLDKHLADAELSTYIVRAFADAAGVGDVKGMDKDAAVKAIATVQAVAGKLPDQAVDQARRTLGALGADEQVTDQLSLVRHKAVLQSGGKLMYGVFAHEVATCKKGEVKVEVHHAPAHVVAWPDQTKDRVTPQIAPPTGIWKLDLGTRCKGTGVITVTTSELPLKDQAAYDGWAAAQLKELEKAQAGVKIKTVAEVTLDL